MRLQDTLTTTDLDLMAAVMAATGRTPSVYLQPGATLAVVELPIEEAVDNIIIQYAAGTLLVNARRFATCRGYLHREIRRVCRGGGNRDE